MWHNARSRAGAHGVPFTLKLEDVPPVPESCPVLGIPLKRNSKRGPSDSSPSLDRIVPERGYTPDNVRIISNKANRLRSDASAFELLRVALDSVQLEKDRLSTGRG